MDMEQAGQDDNDESDVLKKSKKGKKWSQDMRWRCIVLRYVYSIPVEHISLLLGVSERSIRRWMALFNSTGDVNEPPKIKPGESKPEPLKSRFSKEVLDAIDAYVATNPCFYLEELQEWLKENFPSVINISLPTLCRALKHDMRLSRKVGFCTGLHA